MHKLTIAGIMLAMMPFAAGAADLVEPEPAPPQTTEVMAAAPATWDGTYAGLMGGYDWLHADFNVPGNGTRNDRSHTYDGFMLGGIVGYNATVMDNIVLGVEGDINYSWNQRKAAGYRLGTDWGGAIRGRVGYAMDDLLLYGAAGWTMTSLTADPVGPGKTRDRMINGYTVGAGVDYKVSDSMFTRLEYRFNGYGHEKIKGGDARSINLNQHAIILGVGFKF